MDDAKLKEECPECSKQVAFDCVVQDEPFRFGIGDDVVTLVARAVPTFRCHCGFAWTGEAAEEKRAQAVYEYQGRRIATLTAALRDIDEHAKEILIANDRWTVGATSASEASVLQGHATAIHEAAVAAMKGGT